MSLSLEFAAKVMRDAAEVLEDRRIKIDILMTDLVVARAAAERQTKHANDARQHLADELHRSDRLEDALKELLDRFAYAALTGFAACSECHPAPKEVA